MEDNDAAAPDAFTRELRLAPVMTGGTSLAVWMGGVTAELYRVVRAGTDPADDDPGLAIYRDLLTLTRTAARADVITGTSAGGLNGALLAAAIAVDLPAGEFLGLREVWLDLGDLEALLRSPNESSPPSLLRGDDYFNAQLEAVLRRWEARGGRRAGHGGPSPLDLLITVTTVEGEPVVRFDDFGQAIGEYSHAQSLRFRRDGSGRDDFTGTSWAARLAVAARTSASIPGVFEPAFLRVGAHGPARTADLEGLASFPSSRWAVDGGVVVNLPLGEAIGRVFRQPASGELRRVVLYVKPTPTVPPPAVAADAAQAPSILASVLTTVTAPRAEGVAGDIDVVRRHNVEVARQRAARVARLRAGRPGTLAGQAAGSWPAYRVLRSLDSVSSMMDKVAEQLSPTARARQLEVELALRSPRATWLPTAVDAFESPTRPWGWGISSLEYAAAVVMAMLSSALEVPHDATQAQARRDVGATWAVLHQALDDLRAVRALDEAYWAEAVAGAGEVADLAGWARAAYDDWPFLPAPGPDGQPTAVRRAAEALARRFPAIGELGATDASTRTDGVLTALRHTGVAIAGALVGVAGALDTLVEGGLASVGLGGRADDEAMRAQLDAVLVGEHPEGASGPAPLQPRQVEVALTVAGLRDQLRALVPPEAAPHADRVHEALRRLLYLHVVDTVNQGRVLKQEQVLELLQVSWDAPNLLDPSRPPDAKLAGTELGRLGAFLKRSWRANDWMWGRMDGAHRMVLLLADPGRLRQLAAGSGPGMVERVAAVVERAACRAGDDDGRAHLAERWERDGLDVAVRAELAFLDDPALPTPRVLPATTAAIAYAAQCAIAREELPHLADAVERSRRAGGREGDAGSFARRWRRVAPSGTPATRDVASLVQAVGIGSERAGDEVGHDLLTRTVGQALSVTVNALSGERAGTGWAARVLRPARLPVRAFAGLVRAMTSGTRTGMAAVTTALAASGAVVAVRLAGTDVGPTVTAAAVAVFLVGLGVAFVRSRLWIALPSFAVLGVVGLAIAGDGVRPLLVEPPEAGHEWKRWAFTARWSLAWWALALAVAVAAARLVRDAAVWRRGRRARPGRLASRGAGARLACRAVALVVLGPAALAVAPWAASTVLVGDGRAKRWLADRAEWLHDNDLVVVTVAVVALGVAVGVAWDRWVAVRASRGLARAVAWWRGGPGVTRPTLVRWFLAAAVVAVASFAVVAFLDTRLEARCDADEAPCGGIVVLELAGREDAATVVANWGDGGLAAWSLVVDEAFLVAYGAALALAVVLVAGPRRRLGAGAWVAAAAAACDAAENAALAGFLAGRSAGWAQVGRVFALTKFALIGVVVVWLAVAVVARLAGRARPAGAQSVPGTSARRRGGATTR